MCSCVCFLLGLERIKNGHKKGRLHSSIVDCMLLGDGGAS